MEPRLSAKTVLSQKCIFKTHKYDCMSKEKCHVFSKEIHCLAEPFIWYFWSAVVTDTDVHCQVTPIFLALRPREPPCWRSCFLTGGSPHTKTAWCGDTKPRPSFLNLGHLCKVIPAANFLLALVEVSGITISQINFSLCLTLFLSFLSYPIEHIHE